MLKCPVKDCPLGLLCVKSCYWWNEKDECDWTKKSEDELEKGTKEQIQINNES